MMRIMVGFKATQRHPPSCDECRLDINHETMTIGGKIGHFRNYMISKP